MSTHFSEAISVLAQQAFDEAVAHCKRHDIDLPDALRWIDCRLFEEDECEPAVFSHVAEDNDLEVLIDYISESLLRMDAQPEELDTLRDQFREKLLAIRLKAENYSDRVLGSTQGLLPGEIVDGRYVVHRLIGRGGTSRIYLAVDSNSRAIVLKLLNRAPVDSKSEFINSAVARHRNIRRVLAEVTHRGSRVLVMEFAHWTLYDLIKSDDPPFPLTLQHRYSIASQICAGLARLHAIGLAHGDLKPRNIGINPIGTRVVAKLLDMPAAEYTLQYLDPSVEPQDRHDPQQAAQSDVFALGLILQELCPDPMQKELKQVLERAVDVTEVESRPTLKEIQRAIPDVNDAHYFSTDDVYGDSDPPYELIRSLSLFLLVAGALLVSWLMADRARLVEKAELKFTPQQMQTHAREVIRDVVGNVNIGGNGYGGYTYLGNYADESQVHRDTTGYWFRIEGADAGPLRRSIGRNISAPMVSYWDPPFGKPGTIQCLFSPRKELIELRAIPNESWKPLHPEDTLRQKMIRCAGLPSDGWEKQSNVNVVNPHNIPNAETSTWIHNDLNKRFQISTVDQTLVWFTVETSRGWPMDYHGSSKSAYSLEAQRATDVLLIIGVGLAGLFIWAQWKFIDRSGLIVAFRVACAVGGGMLIGWIVTLFGDDSRTSFYLQHGLANAVFWGLLAFLCSLAIEPAWRRSSPRLVKSWINFWTFDWDQPAVGKDILVGCAVAMSLSATLPLLNVTLRALIDLTSRDGYWIPPPESLQVVESPIFLVAIIIETFSNSLFYTIWLGMILILARVISTLSFNLLARTLKAAWPKLTGPNQQRTLDSSRGSVPRYFGALALTSIVVTYFFSNHFADDAWWYPYMGVWALGFVGVAIFRGLLASWMTIGTFIVLVYTPMTQQDVWYSPLQWIGVIAILSTAAIGVVSASYPRLLTQLRRLCIQLMRLPSS